MKTNLLPLLAALCLLTATCGGDGGDPLAPGGGNPLGPGASRANSAVTESNQYEACQVFFEQIIDSFRRGINITTTTAYDGEAIRFIGASNGSCTVTMYDTTRVNAVYGGVTYFASYLRIKYENYYSEAGSLYYFGELQIVGRWYENEADQLVLDTGFATGTLDISGDYGCTVKFTGLSILLENNVLLDLPELVRLGPTCGLDYLGMMEITSDGAPTINFNLYAFDSEGCEGHE